MAGIDTKTLAVAQQYAEQLALGGAGLQEKVESSVNEYLHEKSAVHTYCAYFYDVVFAFSNASIRASNAAISATEYCFSHVVALSVTTLAM